MTAEERQRKEARQHKKVTKEIEEMDIPGTMKYYRTILDTIRVIGKTSCSSKGKSMNRETKDGTFTQVRAKNKEEAMHNRFMDLSAYLNEYSQRLGNNNSGMLPNEKKLKKGELPPEPSEEENVQAAVYKADNLFPLEAEGKHKGQYVPQKDARGNAIVDPTVLIQNQSFLIDYNVWKSCVEMQKSFEKVAKDC